VCTDENNEIYHLAAWEEVEIKPKEVENDT
jgi:hypothetical protein